MHSPRGIKSTVFFVRCCGAVPHLSDGLSGVVSLAVFTTDIVDFGLSHRHSTRTIPIGVHGTTFLHQVEFGSLDEVCSVFERFVFAVPLIHSGSEPSRLDVLDADTVTLFDLEFAVRRRLVVIQAVRHGSPFFWSLVAFRLTSGEA